MALGPIEEQLGWRSWEGPAAWSLKLEGGARRSPGDSRAAACSREEVTHWQNNSQGSEVQNRTEIYSN